jgi:comEA protein
MSRRTFTLAAVLALAVLLPPALANKKPPPQPVNLNTATSEQLQQVPGIGPSTADKILQVRKSYGAFKSVDDLRAIRGIGPKRLEKMRKYLVVAKTPVKPLPTPSKKPSANPSAVSAKKSSTPAKPAPDTKPDPPETEEPQPEAESRPYST